MPLRLCHRLASTLGNAVIPRRTLAIVDAILLVLLISPALHRFVVGPLTNQIRRFNDIHGHGAGDAVLNQVGRFLEGHLRAEDVVCRYGGEEFVVLLPGADATHGRHCADQLRAGLGALDLRYDDDPLPPCSASFGVATFPVHGKKASELLRLADAALYRAKSEGRDRVSVSDGWARDPLGRPLAAWNV